MFCFNFDRIFSAHNRIDLYSPSDIKEVLFLVISSVQDMKNGHQRRAILDLKALLFLFIICPILPKASIFIQIPKNIFKL